MAGIAILTLFLFMGCAGNYAHLRNLSDSKSKANQQEFLDNWSDYTINYNRVVIVFDPKDDDKKILVYNSWSTVKDQETWIRLVNGGEKLSLGYNLVWGEPIREIWVHDQFYGYVSHRERELVSVPIIDENTVRLIHTHSGDWRNQD